MKPVLVSVQSIQRDPEGQELKIELVSEGKYYIKDGTQYIVYEESELTEMKGVTTVIKVLPGVRLIVAPWEAPPASGIPQGKSDALPV